MLVIGFVGVAQLLKTNCLQIIGCEGATYWLKCCFQIIGFVGTTCGLKCYCLQIVGCVGVGQWL